MSTGLILATCLAAIVAAVVVAVWLRRRPRSRLVVPVVARGLVGAQACNLAGDEGAMSERELIREERWVPIDESGQRWVGRSKSEAEQAMTRYPFGHCYADGAYCGGIAEIVREVRYVTEWTEERA